MGFQTQNSISAATVYKQIVRGRIFRNRVPIERLPVSDFANKTFLNQDLGIPRQRGRESGAPKEGKESPIEGTDMFNDVIK